MQLSVLAKTVTAALVALGTMLMLTSRVDVQENTYYVRAGAAGTGTGRDWTNAYAALPSTLVRGATYYVADGTYGSHTFDAAASGTQVITIRKATLPNHGTNVGWVSDFGDGAATWTSWTISTPFWIFDGQVGQGASTLYGVPGPDRWKPYQPYGFRIRSSSSSDNAKVVRVEAANVTIRHAEIGFTNTPGSAAAWGQSADIVYAVTGAADNLVFSYCWIHDAGRVNFLVIGTYGFLVEHSVLERNGHGAAAGGDTQHSEIYSADHVDNHTFRYNLIRDWRSTGGLILHNDNGLAPPITNWKAYGNVFTTTGYWGTGADSNGVINTLSDSQGTSAYVYNNTFVDVDYGCSVLTFGTYSARSVRNNIFYNCRRLGGDNSADVGGGSYNWYFGSGNASEPSMQSGTGDPFLGRAGGDYSLSRATASGISLTSPYTTDPRGSTRGADGIWDRGAFEYSGTTTSAPLAPSAVRIVR
jgi:hypothetical protein